MFQREIFLNEFDFHASCPIKSVLKHLPLYVNRFGVQKWKFKVNTQAHATRARVLPGLVGKTEEFCLLPEPIGLQDSHDSARSRIA